MKRRLLVVTLMASCVALVAATSASYAAYVLRMTVNADKSVTIEWALTSTDVSNLSIVVDCCVVHSWRGVDRSTRFTTAPLAAGRHTIAIQVFERYWTNTYYEPSRCDVSSRASFRWVCSRSKWTAPMVVLVPSERRASCVVPAVVGLRLEDAKTRIALAKCSVGAVIRRDSKRPSGTVLDQRPREKLRLAKGTTISLVVSNGQLPA